MEHSLENENKLNVTCDIFMNEVVMAKQNVEKKSKINPSLEFERGGNLQIDNKKEIIQQNL